MTCAGKSAHRAGHPGGGRPALSHRGARASGAIYRIYGLTPGRYVISARATDVEPDDLADTSFLQQLRQAAVAVRIGEGQVTTQDLRIAQ